MDPNKTQFSSSLDYLTVDLSIVAMHGREISEEVYQDAASEARRELGLAGLEELSADEETELKDLIRTKVREKSATIIEDEVEDAPERIYAAAEASDDSGRTAHLRIAVAREYSILPGEDMHASGPTRVAQPIYIDGHVDYSLEDSLVGQLFADGDTSPETVLEKVLEDIAPILTAANEDSHEDAELQLGIDGHTLLARRDSADGPFQAEHSESDYQAKGNGTGIREGMGYHSGEWSRVS